MDQFIKYIDDNIRALQVEADKLQAEDCRDEANLVKIKINVYGIAKTYYDVVQRTYHGDDFSQEFENRVRRPSEAWKVSYEKAKVHNDIEKTVIEEIKLHTLEDIIKKYKEL